MILQGIAACIGVAGFALLGGALGRVWLRWLGVTPEASQDPFHLVGALALGWGTISLLLLGLGWVHAFHPMGFLLVLAGCAALGAPQVEPLVRDWRALWRTWRTESAQASRLERWIMRFLGLHALVSFVATWAPPTFWDALVYHLGLPQLFLMHRQVVGVDGGNILAASHLATQLLYGLGLGLGSEVWPAVLHWLCGVLSAVTLYWIGRSWWSREVGLWAASCLYATPLMNTLGGGPLIDLALVWYTSVALWGFGRWLVSFQWRDALLLGCFAGCAAGTKISGLGLIVLLAGMMGLRGLTQRRFRTACVAPALTLAMGALVVSPWLVKSFIEHGTPWFLIQASREMGLERMSPLWAVEDLGGSCAGSLRLLWRILTLPFALTWQPGAYDGWRFSAGPWLVTLVPLLVWCARDRRLPWVLACSGLMLIAGYVASFQFNRLLAPAYPAVALASGYALWRSASWGRPIQRVLHGVACAWAILNLGLLAAQDVGRWQVILGGESRETYLSRRMDSFPVMAYASHALPLDAVVCTMDPRVFYLAREYRIGDPGYQLWMRLHEQASAETLLRTLQAAGVTHLLVNWPYARRTQDVGIIGVSLTRFLQLWNAGLAQRCRMVYQAGDVALYAISYHDGTG